MARPRQISDQDIREAARNCFLALGPAVSVAEVAKQLGVSPPAIFRRVGDKEALLKLALDPGPPPARLLRLLEGPDPELSIYDQLKFMLQDMLAFFRRVIPSLLVMRASGRVPEDIFLPVRAEIDLKEWLQAVHRSGRGQFPDAETSAELLIGAVEASCLRDHLRDFTPKPHMDAGWAHRMAMFMTTGHAWAREAAPAYPDETAEPHPDETAEPASESADDASPEDTE